MLDSRERKLIEIERRKMHIVEMESQMKIRQAEMEEVRTRIMFMKELKELGHSNEEIERFMAEQFVRGEGPSSLPTQNREDEAVVSDDSDGQEEEDSDIAVCM